MRSLKEIHEIIENIRAEWDPEDYGQSARALNLVDRLLEATAENEGEEDDGKQTNRR